MKVNQSQVASDPFIFAIKGRSQTKAPLTTVPPFPPPTPATCDERKSMNGSTESCLVFDGFHEFILGLFLLF